MLSSIARRLIVPLTLGCLWMVTARPCLSMQTQAQKPNAQQQKSDKSGKGSAQNSSANKPVSKSSDADKLNNERMSTRGLHRPAKTDQGDKSGKVNGQSTSKPDSTTKPDSQK
jgi:hypothetical protein